jgi:hypothetical protein
MYDGLKTGKTQLAKIVIPAYKEYRRGIPGLASAFIDQSWDPLGTVAQGRSAVLLWL